MPYNASNTRDIRRAEREARHAEEERHGFILNIMSNQAGRNYICDLLLRCHVFSSSFSSDAFATAFSEGERNIGLQILADVTRFAPDQYIQMMRERNDRELYFSGGSSRDNETGNGRDQQSDSPAGGGIDSEYDPGDDDRSEA